MTTSDHLRITSEARGDDHVFTLSGELDVHSANRLLDALHGAAAGNPRSVTIDVAQVSFADSAGLRAFVLGRSMMRDVGSTFRLVGTTGPLARLLQITGLNELLTC